MARIPRLYRVLATYRNGDESEWHYQRPELASDRAAKLRDGRYPALNDAEARRHRDAGTQPDMDEPVSVKIQASHPITWPHEAGDTADLGLPGTTIDAGDWGLVLQDLGVRPDRVLSVTWHRGERIQLELENGKHAPTHWSIEITESNTNESES